MTTNPRLIDAFGIELKQEEVSFAIPRLEQDIPLWFDPFLAWTSEKPAYQALHNQILAFLARVARYSVRDESAAARLLAGCREEPALGLGYGARGRRGQSVGPQLIAAMIQAHQLIPQLTAERLRHLEELQLVVPRFAEDRVSDIAAGLAKQFFIDFTATNAERWGIPARLARVRDVFDAKKDRWVPAPESPLPFNPATGEPILFVPLDLLRHLPWIRYEDYYRRSYAPRVAPSNTLARKVAKDAVLAFNARNYIEVERYVDEREARRAECKPDPLFSPLTSGTIAAKIRRLRALPTGRGDGADREYEELVGDILRSCFFPTLEFAESRVRTVTGAHIRDLIFYNDGKAPFWADMRERYEARQPVFELKNVQALETEHVNQLYRYLDEEFGRFGVLVTRNPIPPAVEKNVVDLHSSKRVIILCLDDRDSELLVPLMEAKRDPAEVCMRKYLELSRLFPK